MRYSKTYRSRGNERYMSRDQEQTKAYQYQQQQRHQHEHQQHDKAMRENQD